MTRTQRRPSRKPAKPAKSTKRAKRRPHAKRRTTFAARLALKNLKRAHKAEAKLVSLRVEVAVLRRLSHAPTGHAPAGHAPAVAPAEKMILVDTLRGVCAILPSEVISIGSLFEKHGLPDQRILYLRGGHKEYVLDSRVNVEKLVGPAMAAQIDGTPLHPAVSKIQGAVDKAISKPSKYRRAEREDDAEPAPAPIRKQLRASVKAQAATAAVTE